MMSASEARERGLGLWRGVLSACAIYIALALVLGVCGCSDSTAPATQFKLDPGCRHGFVLDSTGLHERCTLVKVVPLP